jgi:hypothetical protein
VLDVAPRDVLGDNSDASTSMGARTRQATDEGRLSRKGVEAVNAVRSCSNAAVHEEPASADMARETLGWTSEVLEVLFGDLEEWWRRRTSHN